MGTPTTFERQELKYRITYGQRKALNALMQDHMKADCFGRSTIHNIYYDTPDFHLIRHSLEKPIYKEKLRVRSYGPAKPEGTVYVELKKKYNGIVYKRRVAVTQSLSCQWLNQGRPPQQSSQIIREVDYFRKRFTPLTPAVLLTYEREAFFGRENPEFRMTFDDRILWRDEDISLCAGAYGAQLLLPGTQLLEVKSPFGMPLWLTRFFSENSIFKTSFSKYGAAYLQLQGKEEIGGILSA